MAKLAVFWDLVMHCKLFYDENYPCNASFFADSRILKPCIPLSIPLHLYVSRFRYTIPHQQIWKKKERSKRTIEGKTTLLLAEVIYVFVCYL